jgi:hypothetical protein
MENMDACGRPVIPARSGLQPQRMCLQGVDAAASPLSDRGRGAAFVSKSNHF